MKKVGYSLFVLLLAVALSATSVFASTKMDSVIDELIGTPYKYGGTTTRGFDCSGFTSYVFKQFKLELPRTSGAQAKIGQKVAKSDLRPGDLVFFNTSGRGISHVGIFVGDGQFAHASSSKGVIISSMNSSYYVNRFVTARRVMDQKTFEKFADDPATEAIDPAGDSD